MYLEMYITCVFNVIYTSIAPKLKYNLDKNY